MAIIEVSNLTKDYGAGRGVFDVSFSVGKGEVFGFLGPNGAGKSTTIRHLMGFSKPQSGKTQIFGKDTFEKYFEILGNVGYIPGEIALPAGLTGWEFIRMMQSLQGKRDEKRLGELLERFELDPSGETKRMSLGVKRKLAVVTAFMHDPEVLILDEPTSGLDPVMQEVFVTFVSEEKQRGKTVLLSSHIFSEVDATCDRIAIIKDGRLVSDFVADDLRHARQKKYRITLEDTSECAALAETMQKAAFALVHVANPADRQIVFETNDAHINDTISLLRRYKIVCFEHLKETLEDYFMRYYKEDKDFGGALHE